MEDTPPFPSGLREIAIPRISLRLLLNNDASEVREMTTACKTHGFFYMNLEGCELGAELLEESEELLNLSRAAFALSREEKDAVAVSKTRSVFGFKTAGITNASDPYKRKDKGEMWNVAKDDAVSNTCAPQIPYPPLLRSSMPLFRTFSQNAHSTGILVLRLLAPHLAISSNEIVDRHRITASSGDHTRLTWAPAAISADAVTPNAKMDESKISISTYAHTDFGSFTILFNWLGGLQIQVPQEKGDDGKEEWAWVRPLPNHAICNLGDAMVVFSGERLRSGRHRVICAPGEQARQDRHSVVYFVRPEDDVYLEDLTPTDKGETAQNGENGKKKWKAKDWIEAKVKGMGNKLSSD